MLGSLLLISFLLVATVTDLRQHKIFNWTTYPGILSALALSALVSFFGGSRLLGQVTFRDSSMGLLACGGLMLICYVFFKVGGGDVKLLAMVGAFLGPRPGIEALLLTFVIGAAFGLIFLVWRFGALTLLKRFGQYALAALRLRGVTHVKGSLDAEVQTSLFLAPSALAAVLIVCSKLLGPYSLV